MGSFLVAVVQFARSVLAYVEKNSSQLKEGNRLAKIMFKVIALVLWCFERTMKFITKNAYIMVAMRGVSFCSGAK